MVLEFIIKFIYSRIFILFYICNKTTMAKSSQKAIVDIAK
nr:MAG TPA: hypothetical protein [Caudoviricetes sp.]